jgi:signal peptidase I
VRVNRRLVVAGFALAGLALVLGPFAALPAVVVGCVVVARGRGGLGAGIIVTAVVMWAAFAFIILVVLEARAFKIPSEAMDPTLQLGDRFVTTGTSSPQRGDIVTFNPPVGAVTRRCGADHPADSACPRPRGGPVELTFIKRVVAVGGDRVSISGGAVRVNGRLQDLPAGSARLHCPVCDLPKEITIPAGHYFMLGDNRALSSDSREWGPVPGDWIIGVARFRYWPPGRAGGL